jgi:hypothetical protein
MPRRPPKEWFYYVVGELEKVKGITDPKAVAGWMWYHWMKPETKKAILRGERLDPDAIIKVRKGLTTKPKVEDYSDYEGEGTIRVLFLKNGKNFPEFAITTRFNENIIKALEDAGFTEEKSGKWVLRTNKFNIFIYV